MHPLCKAPTAGRQAFAFPEDTATGLQRGRAVTCSAPAELETLHPGLWRAHQVGRPREAVFASGFDPLDAVLPGGGWPAGVLTELLLPHPGVGELRLLAPVLAHLQRKQQERCLMWFDPPAAPCAWALEALGLSARQMVLVRSDPLRTVRTMRSPLAQRRPGAAFAAPASQAVPAALALWALEHALKSGHVGAVLAWLPARLPSDALRRLQLAALGHEGPAFLLRSEEAARHASPAPLRLRLSAAAPDWLRVHLLKRRGPPLAQPLLLRLAPVLSAPALAKASAGMGALSAATGSAASVVGPSAAEVAAGMGLDAEADPPLPQHLHGSWA